MEGEGGQGRLSTPHVAGRSAGQPSLAHIPKKVIVVVMVKGPWSLGPLAPSIHFLLMHAQVHADSKGAAKPRRRSRKKVDETKEKTRGKG